MRREIFSKMEFLKIRCALAGALLLLVRPLIAQVPDAPSVPAPAQPAPPASAPANPSSGGSAMQQSSFLGKDVPVLNPASEIVTWDGHNWNINNNRIFEARFEKYLNAPDWKKMSIRICCGIVLPRTCLGMGLICGSFRSCLGMPTFPQPRFTPTSISSV